MRLRRVLGLQRADRKADDLGRAETWRMGVAPEEIPIRMPHLTLAQVFGALTYYSDHQAEINRYIEQNRIPDELIDPLARNYE
ncbi:MAG: hypothetical protein OHK0037_14060 [Elainellaceae cyanobacterium]